MNLRQLYYFKELVEQKQFSKAAKKLNISQPSLSNSLKSLETELDCQLIDRSGGQIQLTQFGKIFYDASLSSVSSIEKAKAKINQLKNLKENTLSIATIPPAFNEFTIPTILDYQKQTKTKTKFNLTKLNSNEIYEGIRNNNIDLGICLKNEAFKDISFIPLYTIQCFVTVKNNNPLAKKGYLKLSDLETFPVITYNEQTEIGKEIRHILNKNNNHITLKSAGIENSVILSKVLINNEIAILLNNQIPKNWSLCTIPFKPQKAIKLYLAYKKQKSKKTNVTQVTNFIKNLLS